MEVVGTLIPIPCANPLLFLLSKVTRLATLSLKNPVRVSVNDKLGVRKILCAPCESPSRVRVHATVSFSSVLLSLSLSLSQVAPTLIQEVVRIRQGKEGDKEAIMLCECVPPCLLLCLTKDLCTL